MAIYSCIWERGKGNIQTSQELLDIASEMTWIPRDLNYHHGPPATQNGSSRRSGGRLCVLAEVPLTVGPTWALTVVISSILGYIKGKIKAWQLAEHSHWRPGLGSRGHYGWKGRIESAGIPGNCQVQCWDQWLKDTEAVISTAPSSCSAGINSWWYIESDCIFTSKILLDF